MRQRFVALAVTVGLLAGCGAAGLGDPYFPNYGNGGYDVAHYDLAVTYDPGTDQLRGIATITARATQDLASFNLDLVGMTVRRITVDEARAPGTHDAQWSRGPHELVVVPHARLENGRNYTIVVHYDGTPTTVESTLGEGGFFHTDDGALVVGQPEVAATWFPVNDHPLDKATYTFRVKVPVGYGVVANGLPVGTSSSAGWTTHVWEARSPMASYLATVDIGQWQVNARRTARGLPIIDAVDPDVAAFANPSLARQDEMLSVLESRFGPYPFEAAGAIVDDHPGIFFALENQTRPVYSYIFFILGEGDAVVVHELAHQWFGDSVALARWQDIWLNEGFATYAEWLWLEHEGFVDAPRIVAAETLASTPPDDPFWDLPIGDPGPLHLFDEPVYLRGAMTLQALRETIGDTSFFALLRVWASTNKDRHGTTPQFIDTAERISGRQLDGLFQTWLFSPERPTVPAAAQGVAASRTTGDARTSEWRAGLALRLAHGAR